MTASVHETNLRLGAMRHTSVSQKRREGGIILTTDGRKAEGRRKKARPRAQGNDRLRVSAVLIATTNPGKLREIRIVLEGLPYDWQSIADIGPIDEPEETGQTFAENALLKARYYAAASGLPTVAEDSGLVIDALNGRPGVTSARYPGATYPDKFHNLYRELASHPRPWTARFVCSLAFVAPESPGIPGFHFGLRPWAFSLGSAVHHRSHRRRRNRGRSQRCLRVRLRPDLFLSRPTAVRWAKWTGSGNLPSPTVERRSGNSAPG